MYFLLLLLPPPHYSINIRFAQYSLKNTTKVDLHPSISYSSTQAKYSTPPQSMT